ncbi:MAG: hypothetical protein IPQ22_15155 [Rhodoferax sp.]|nr:hypothetical protein [Rhodoferax sp.]
MSGWRTLPGGTAAATDPVSVDAAAGKHLGLVLDDQAFQGRQVVAAGRSRHTQQARTQLTVEYRRLGYRIVH